MRNPISLYWGSPREQSAFTTRILCAGLLLWLIVITVLTALMVAAGIEWAYAQSDRRGAFNQSMLAALTVSATVVTPTVLVRLVRPRLTLAVLTLMTSGVVIALATGAGALPDLCVVAVIGVAAYALGRLALERLIPRAAGPPLESLVLATGLGAGLLGLIALALGLVGWLRLPAIVVVLVPLAAMSIWRWRSWLAGRVHTDGLHAALTPAWYPGWVNTILLCITMAFLAVGAILAVAPEVRSDAVRVHLPIIRAFAEQGRVPALDYLGTARWPVNGHALYAIGFSLHGQLAAKMLHTGVVWLTVAAAVAFGARYGGITAGVAAAALVASMPVMVWEAGVGYVDALPVLYTLLGALSLLRWQNDGRKPWLLLLGMMLGFGVAAKLTFAFSAAALVLALLIVGRDGATFRSRLIAMGWVAVGGLVTAGPWLARSIWLTGELPGLSLFRDAVGRGAGEAPASLGTLPGFGIGRGPLGFVMMPIELTFRSQLFGENLPGFIGVALLLLLPTIIFLPRQRATVTLAVIVLGQYLLWFLTAQYIRYFLPTLALLAILLGAGFARLLDGARNRPGSLMPTAGFVAAASLIAALSTSLLFFIAGIVGYPGGLPVALVLGQQNQEAFLASTLRDYEVLQRLNRLVPPGEPVGGLTRATSQLYTHAVVLTQSAVLPELLTASSEAELFAALDREGVEFVIVDRPSLPPEWGTSLLLQREFLERHTTTIFAANDVYLYRLHQATGTNQAEPSHELAGATSVNLSMFFLSGRIGRPA